MTTIPKYVIPGQIICPIFERVSTNTNDNSTSKPSSSGLSVCKYIPGKGVSISHLPNDIVALTANLLGRTVLEAVATDGNKVSSETFGSSSFSSTVGQTHGSERSNGNRRSVNNVVGPVKVIRVSVEDKLVSPNQYQGFIESNTQSHNKQQQKIEPRVTCEASSVLPAIGSVVLARVTKLTLRQAYVQILSIENSPSTSSSFSSSSSPSSSQPTSASATALTNNAVDGNNHAAGLVNTTSLGEGFAGIVRSHDVRLTERDKVKIADSFKPGDIIRASVVSTNPNNSFFPLA